MSKPKVSVVVPVYNVEKYLDRCVQSLLSQTLKDIEIILVDDGSPDNCPQMCDEYCRQDSRVKVVHKQNAGLGMACNSGLEVATGEYIAFCDSDDWIDADMYETMCIAAKENNADAVYTGLKRVETNGKILGYLPHPNAMEIFQEERVKFLAMDIIASEPSARNDHRIQVSAKTVIYRHSLIDKFHLRFVSEREFPSEDLIFNVAFLMKARKIYILPNYFYNYFVNQSSITATIKPNQFEKITRSANKLAELTDGNKTFKIRIYRFLIGESRTYCRLLFNSSLTCIEKKQLVRQLSQNDALQDAIAHYPTSKIPIMHLFALLLLKRNYFHLLKLLYTIR